MVCCKNPKCRKRKKTNALFTICWDQYGLCGRCCAKEHPQRYPRNVRAQLLSGKMKEEKGYGFSRGHLSNLW